MKTLTLFENQSCQIFNRFKRCNLKNAVLRSNKTSGKSDSVAPKCKMVEKCHRIDRHLQIGLNPNFLGNSHSPWTGTNMHKWFDGQSNFREKVPAFLKSHKCRGGKQENPRIVVSVFLCTFEIIALHLKKFHLLLHCYTLPTGARTLHKREPTDEYVRIRIRQRTAKKGNRTLATCSKTLALTPHCTCFNDTRLSRVEGCRDRERK